MLYPDELQLQTTPGEVKRAPGVLSIQRPSRQCLTAKQLSIGSRSGIGRVDFQITLPSNVWLRVGLPQTLWIEERVQNPSYHDRVDDPQRPGSGLLVRRHVGEVLHLSLGSVLRIAHTHNFYTQPWLLSSSLPGVRS